MDHLGDAIQGVIDLLDMLGGAVRRIVKGSKHSTMEKWRSQDNTWVGVAVLVVLGVFLVFIVGCGESPDPKGPSTSTGSDSTETPEQAEERVAEPSHANAVAREVVAGNIPAHLDEVLVQSMIDSLASPLPATRMLQAQAMTRLWPQADGAVAESMGFACKEYVLDHTQEFFALFPEHIDAQAMSIWVDMVTQELLIDEETELATAVDRFRAELLANCPACAIDIKRFGTQLSSRMNDLTAQP